MATKDLRVILAKDDEARKRWFSTGFMVGGVASVDAEKHTLKSAVLIRPGEALGHGVWIDQEFCKTVVAMAADGKAGRSGLKARFGHPNMCNDALGTFLGRWTDVTIDEAGFTRGDLHISSTAAESPKGDLRKYVEEMAAKEPAHFGASIVFSMDYEKMKAESIANGAEEKDGLYGKYLDFTNFKSPDPANVENLPHARCAELHAADLVDDPAATDGLFSGAAGLSLAAQMTEWLDTHGEVFKALQEPGVIDLVSRYSAELQPFLERYTQNQKKLGTVVQTTTTVWTDDKPDPNQSPEAKSSDEQAANTAKSVELQARLDALEGQLSAAKAESVTLSGQLAAACTRADTAEASNKALTAEREQLAGQVQTLTAEKAALKAECDKSKVESQDLDQRLKALSAGQLPVSSVPAPTETTKGNMMEDARKSKRK